MAAGYRKETTMWLSASMVSGKWHSRRARPVSKASRLLVEELESRTLPSLLAPVSYPVGAYPEAVAVGDFTGSGIPDLVVANHQSGTVSVLLGNGDGTFQPALNYVLPAQPPGTQTPLSVAVGDFNKDGKLDLAVTAY